MEQIIDIAIGNILSPVILFFFLGVLAGIVKSDLEIPEILAKSFALYLVAAIGLKGGIKLAEYPVDGTLLAMFGVVILGCAIIPFIGYGLLRLTSGLDRLNTAALAAHYGSVSLVTFIAATEFLKGAGLDFPGYMIALLAIMETPAILSGLYLSRFSRQDQPEQNWGVVLREVFLNGTVVLLVGSMVIGYLINADGIAAVQPFFIDPFKGVLCFFLLDMGIIIGKRIEVLKTLGWRVVLYGIYKPLIGAAMGFGIAALFGLNVSETTIIMTLFASASYIAVPAAMKLALPKADASIYVSLPLGITFPFNIVIGIPLYYWIAQSFAF